MPSSNSVPFVWYGVLQVAFIFILFSNFILTMSLLLSENDTTDGGEYLVLPLLIASAIMLLASCLVFHILIYRARTGDLVGNLRIRKRSASFKVALLSWILTGIETILRLVGLFHFRSEALGTLDHLDELDQSNSPWWIVVIYHILLLFQTTFQIACLHAYEKNTRIRREGPGWMITRKSFLIIMAFMNCYMWVLNVAKIRIIVDLTSPKMEELLTGSVETIVYTVNRASTLAYHVESVQLLYKFYEEDSETLVQQQYVDLDRDENIGIAQIFVETDSAKGTWGGFLMFVVFVSMAGGSFLVRTNVTSIHYSATLATAVILLTILGITLNTSLSHDNSNIALRAPPPSQVNQANNILENQEVNQVLQPRSINMFADITSYLAGEKVGHLRILLFYSICAVSYHFLLTMKIIFNGFERDTLQPVREGCKGLACICLTVFMFWMSHEHRKLRCWRDLHVMLWTVLALVFLELIEETYEHSKEHEDPLQLGALLPLAIDFKIYVLIHTFNDTIAARNDYRQELRRDPTASNPNSRSVTPSLESSINSASIRYI